MRAGFVVKKKLFQLLKLLPIDDEFKVRVASSIKHDFASANPGCRGKASSTPI
jgi:hypothetical protein